MFVCFPIKKRYHKYDTSFKFSAKAECSLGTQLKNEWTITRDILEYSYLINSLSYYIMNAPYEVATVTSYSGSVASVGVHETGIIRPTFYLNSDVQYVSGTGTETDPYRIA